MANPEHLALLRQGKKVWNEWRRKNLEIKPDLREANLIGANLIEAKLIGANLSQTKLIGANLSGTNLSGAKLSQTNLSQTKLIGAKLIGAKLIGANLSGVSLSKADLRGADLRGAFLSKADLSGTNLSEAILIRANLKETNLSEKDLSEVNLSETNLSRTQALNTNFEGATFTGACIKDWNINSQTNLNNVICDYVYLKEDKQERRPHDPNKNFASGEFTKLFQKVLETVDLIFSDGIDWKAVAYSLKNVQVLNENTPLTIQSIENKGDGVVLIRVSVLKDADKHKIESDFWKGYEFAEKTLKETYEVRLLDKDKEINRLFTIINHDKEVQKLMAEQPKFQQNFNAHVNAVAQNVEGNQNIYAPEQKQTLAEAAAEIQQLLTQLQSQGFSPEKAQQQAANDLATKAKDNPTIKEKLVKWGQSLGDTAAQTTVSEAAKEVVKLALRLSGVPLP